MVTTRGDNGEVFHSGQYAKVDRSEFFGTSILGTVWILPLPQFPICRVLWTVLFVTAFDPFVGT